MVATISVLGGGARGVAAYFTATSGYYDVERRGEWFGTATEKLGLSGEVDRHEFEMLLAGFTPGGDRLARKTSAPSARSSRQAESGDVPGNQGKRRADRVPGYDVCFSAPKSVSLLWAVGSKQVRTEIESCMTDAVSKTLKDMESLQALGQEKAHFRDWNVVSQVCESLQHYGVDATSLVPQVIEHLRQSPSVMPLDTNPRQQQYSTQKN